ncbi:MAG: SGNH/GDSL hydrolase family protein [Elainellaceae cyanobacterium]
MKQLQTGLAVLASAALFGLSACSGSAGQPADVSATGATDASVSKSSTPQHSVSSGLNLSKQQDNQGPILAIGDSIFQWNTGEKQSIPDVIGQTLHRPVTNSAVSGAHLSHPDVAAAEAGYDIRQQYDDQGWDWVVVNGGANDLNGGCACEGCDTQIDAMISEDGLSGEIPEFLRTVAATGSKVMYVGYYAMPDDARFGFDQCDDEIATQNARLMRMAGALEGVWFVSASDVVSAEDVEAYALDRIHPSIIGSKRVGEQVARAIQAAEAE